MEKKKKLYSRLLLVTWAGAVLELSASFSWGISRLIKSLISVMFPLSELTEPWANKKPIKTSINQSKFSDTALYKNNFTKKHQNQNSQNFGSQTNK